MEKKQPKHIKQYLNNHGSWSNLVNPALLDSEIPTCPYCGELQIMMFDELARRTCNRKEMVYQTVPKFHDCSGGLEAERVHYARLEKEQAIATARQLVLPLETGLYRDFRFGNWDASVSDNARQMLENVNLYVSAISEGKTKRWLFMHGAYGLGKTHLAVAAVRKIAAVKLWRPVVVVWPQHCSAVKESWELTAQEYGATERKLWGNMRGADVLLIDDVDKTDTTSWAIQKLYEVIDYRVVNEKVTIITANHSLKELYGSWKASSTSHIADVGCAILSRITGQVATTLAFAGDDYRREKW